MGDICAVGLSRSWGDPVAGHRSWVGFGSSKRRSPPHLVHQARLKGSQTAVRDQNEHVGLDRSFNPPNANSRNWFETSRTSRRMHCRGSPSLYINSTCPRTKFPPRPPQSPMMSSQQVSWLVLPLPPTFLILLLDPSPTTTIPCPQPRRRADYP